MARIGEVSCPAQRELGDKRVGKELGLEYVQSALDGAKMAVASKSRRHSVYFGLQCHLPIISF